MKNKISQPIIIKISKIIDEGSNFKTFVFDFDLKAKPGQYIMLWMPGVNLKPFSICWQTKKQFALTVLKVGAYTQKLFELNTGDQLGFLGPYGTSYDLNNDKKKILIMGGGSGLASVVFLAQAAREQNMEVDFLLAAKTKEQIIFEDWLTNIGVNVFHRFKDDKYERAFDIFKDLSNKNQYDAWYACGPELLLKKIVNLSLKKDIFCQVSLERYMKCGIGVCGSCCVDPLGICLCQTGPVVNNHFADKITEFSKYHRNAAGDKVNF